MFDASRRIHLLGHDQWFGLKIERDGCVGARRRTDSLHLAPGWLDPGNRVDYRFQVLRSRAATPAHNAHSVVHDEMLVVVGQLLGSEFVYCVPTFVEWQAGI